MKAMTFRYGQASAYIFPLSDDVYAVSNLFSRARGQGHAKGVMQQVIDYADTYDITLRLIAQRYGNPMHPALDNPQLIEFYGNFGFEKEGESKPITMVRHPSQEKHAS